MTPLDIPLGLCVGGLVLLLVLGVGAIVLVKLGVIAQYAIKDEPAEEGDFGLDQSREVGKE
jgi:hypothetical protein